METEILKMQQISFMCNFRIQTMFVISDFKLAGGKLYSMKLSYKKQLSQPNLFYVWHFVGETFLHRTHLCGARQMWNFPNPTFFDVCHFLFDVAASAAK